MAKRITAWKDSNGGIWETEEEADNSDLRSGLRQLAQNLSSIDRNEIVNFISDNRVEIMFLLNSIYEINVVSAPESAV